LWLALAAGRLLLRRPDDAGLLRLSARHLPTATPQSVAAVSTPIPTAIPLAAETATSPLFSGTSPWLAAALIVQVGILLVAGIEFLRRSRRR
ncbi:MAG: hypothetical protein JNM70_18450, partial [Anaerolineae bacterium]|nr:hypothetical protein [Anaerolineae bacterium]